jgi:hypothetical protein
MKKKPITHATLLDLMNNAAVRAVSQSVQDAHQEANAATKAKCSSCARRKQAASASSQLLEKLRSAPDSEIDRIKRALGVDVLVFSNGMTFIER